MLTPTEYVDRCITVNAPINKDMISERTGMTLPEVDTFVYRAICAFVYRSMGSTATVEHQLRDGPLKQKDREAADAS